LQQVQKQSGPDRAQAEHTLHDNRQLRPAPGREARELQRPLVARITWRPVIPRQLDQAASGLGGTQPLAQQLGRDFGRARNDGQRHTLVRKFERDHTEG
jgi:hypothetical protein